MTVLQNAHILVVGKCDLITHALSALVQKQALHVSIYCPFLADDRQFLDKTGYVRDLPKETGDNLGRYDLILVTHVSCAEYLSQAGYSHKTLLVQKHFDPKIAQLGIYGFVSFGQGANTLREAMRCILSGKRYFCSASLMTYKDPFEGLSMREMQVVKFIVKGLSSSQIANILCVSSKTINTYRYRIFKKLQIQGEVALTHLAIKHHLIEAGEGLGTQGNA